MTFYVSYELYAPAKDEWITHVIDMSSQPQRYGPDPKAAARRWWDTHLSRLAEQGELRNYRADWGHPTEVEVS